MAPLAVAPQLSRSIVNLEGAERLPAPPSSTDLDTVPSGTVRFVLLGEIEHGVSTILPTKFTLPSAARGTWADAASDEYGGLGEGDGFHLRFLMVR